MITLVTGGQSTASAWVGKIVSLMLRPRGPLIDREALEREFGIAFAEDSQTEPVFPTIEGCNSDSIQLQATSIKSTLGALFNQHTRRSIPIDAAIRSLRLMGTHLPMGDFLRTPLRPHLSPVLFTHRHPVDEIASYVRVYGLTRDALAQLEDGTAREQILYAAASNAKNYRVLVEDLRKSLLWKRGSLYSIRRGYLDFLDAKEAGVDVHDFRFTDVTIDKEQEEIARIAAILQRSAAVNGDSALWMPDSAHVFETMVHSKTHGNAGFHRNRKKVDFGFEFFGEVLSQQLIDYYGDVMVALGYLARDSYDVFAQRVEPREFVHVGQDPERELQTRKMAARFIDMKSERVIAIEDLARLAPDNAVVFVDSRTGYRAVQEHLESRGSTSRIYPLYRALYGYRAPVFDLDARQCVYQDEVPRASHAICFLHYADSTRKDTFDPLREAIADGKMQVSTREVRVQRDDEASLGALDGFDTAVLCTNNPAEVRSLAQALPRRVRKIAIVPVYRYELAPLIQ